LSKSAQGCDRMWMGLNRVVNILWRSWYVAQGSMKAVLLFLSSLLIRLSSSFEAVVWAGRERRVGDPGTLKVKLYDETQTEGT